jgi:hypothetical protein
METSKKLIGQQSPAPTSFAVDTLANPSALLDSEKEQTTLDTCGPGLEHPLASYDPSTQSWRMSEDTSLWEECKSLENLPTSGMTQSGVLYRQPEWEHRIAGNGSSLWPTPTTANWVTSTSVESTREHMAKGEKYSSRIVQAVALAEPTATGYLNPEWIEWLMGFPIGWTDLED